MSQMSGTKSIDVGSMFLMDLSVHDSELLSYDPADNTTTTTTTSIDKDTTFPQSHRVLQKLDHGLNENRSSTNTNHSLIKQSIAYHRQANQPEYSGNSLDRLASAIEIDANYKSSNEKNLSLVTIVEPQPEIVEDRASFSSLSDESFVASSKSSMSASYTGSSEAGDEERGSTTTREDSGVLDIKDLDGQFNSYDNENEQKFCHQNHQLHQEKPISNDITATNLINQSVHNYTQQHPNRLDRPTYSNNNYHHHHHQQGHRNLSKRSMSASLPIEVPVRQMKKDINKTKMNLMSKNAASSKTDTNKGPSPYRIHDNSTIDDFEYFLEQEYNQNHHNHYPIDEYDEEHLRAEENPMKLFESIQALARSLHEDTELFGSLPPKRMLESPIRSLAFV